MNEISNLPQIQSSGKLPTMCLEKWWWDWIPGKMLKLVFEHKSYNWWKLDYAGSSRKIFKKGRREPGNHELNCSSQSLNSEWGSKMHKALSGLSRIQGMGYFPAKQNHQNGFFEWCCCILLVPSLFCGQQSRGPKHTHPVQVFQNYAKSVSVTLTAFNM